MTEVAKLLCDLVAIPSVSSQSNEAVIEYARRRFSPDAWNVELDIYLDSAGNRKVNLVAATRTSGGKEPALALVCHTDTVPYDPNWPEAVNPAERGGRIYGRGSCDVKGFLACILAAVEEVRPAELERPLLVVLTADEEIGCLGMKRLAAAGRLRARRAIVGEPTGLRPIHGGKGYGLGEIVVRGKEAHSAFPARGRSAIMDAARVVLAGEEVARDLAARKADDFDPPYPTLNIGLIQGGTAKNVIPGECRMVLEWRAVPGDTADFIPREVEARIARLREEFPAMEVEFRVTRSEPPFASDAHGELACFLAGLTGLTPGTVSFGTEAPHFPAEEVVVFGPGDMTSAHRTGEHVPVSELAQCTSHLTACVGRFCGRTH